MGPRLFAFERAWTDAAFDAIYPDGTALGHGVLAMHPARFLDGVLRDVPAEQSIGLRLALWLVALAPLFTIARLGTIASIGPAERTRVLERLLASPVYAVRQLVLSLKAMATLLYAQSVSVTAAMTTPRRLVALRASHRHEQGRTARNDREHAAE
jgi:hypothetical protein